MVSWEQKANTIRNCHLRTENEKWKRINDNHNLALVENFYRCQLYISGNDVILRINK